MYEVINALAIFRDAGKTSATTTSTTATTATTAVVVVVVIVVVVIVVTQADVEEKWYDLSLASKKKARM